MLHSQEKNSRSHHRQIPKLHTLRSTSYSNSSATLLHPFPTPAYSLYGATSTHSWECALSLPPTMLTLPASSSRARLPREDISAAWTSRREEKSGQPYRQRSRCKPTQSLTCSTFLGEAKSGGRSCQFDVGVEGRNLDGQKRCLKERGGCTSIDTFKR